MPFEVVVVIADVIVFFVAIASSAAGEAAVFADEMAAADVYDALAACGAYPNDVGMCDNVIEVRGFVVVVVLDGAVVDGVVVGARVVLGIGSVVDSVVVCVGDDVSIATDVVAGVIGVGTTLP